MDFVLISIGVSIMWLFMEKIELLFGFGISFWIVLIYSIMLFGLSFLLLEINYGNPKIVVSLRMPIISFTVFKILEILFRVIYKRDPENTFWSFERKPIGDIIFSFLFWCLGVVLPFILVM